MKFRWFVPPLLAALWLLLSNSYTLPNLLFAAIAGTAALWLVRNVREPADFRIRPLQVVQLVGLFLVELAKSAVRVLVLALSPRPDFSPGLISLPLRVERDFQIALLANLITLTPGTQSVDVSADRRQLLIHCLDVGDPDQTIADIRNGFEALILEAFP